MNRSISILHFIVTVFLLIITLLFTGLRKEQNDLNAASMYLLVYGFLIPVLWGISFLSIIISLPFFKKRKIEFAAFVMPTLVFVIAIVVMRKGVDRLLWALAAVSTIINVIFYFIYSNKKVSSQ